MTDASLAQGAAKGHGIETEIIDVARYSLGVPGNQSVSMIGKNCPPPFVATDAEAVLDVGASFRGVKGRQASNNRNTLAELNHGGRSEAVGQLGLSRKDDVK